TDRNQFLHKLHKQISDLQEVSTVEECDVVLVFCPIVSRAGIDIEVALKQLINVPILLVVLHSHTFDPERTVPDSYRHVKQKNTITVDCPFHEDKGLLKCRKNNDAMKKMTNIKKWMIFINTEYPAQDRLYSIYLSLLSQKSRELSWKLKNNLSAIKRK
uniref:Uncharacterized protein n=1 Tax=Electrophorus electricus TaxID=8005 RepID=A0AAY5ECY3_ELEEL